MREEIYYFDQTDNLSGILTLFICGITFPDKNYEITRQNSNVSCIEYIEGGSGFVKIDNESFIARGGDSYFLKEGKYHHYYADKKTPWKKYFINFSGELTKTLTDVYGLGGTSYFKGLNLKTELLKIIELAKNKNENITVEIIKILNEMFFKLHLFTKQESKVDSVAYKMKSFLDSKVTSNFVMADLFKHVSLSESQGIKVFKKTYNVTPYAYLLSKKIELAKKILLNTSLTVKEISRKLCFLDEYYFSNLFKQKVGVSPIKFRKGQKKDLTSS